MRKRIEKPHVSFVIHAQHKDKRHFNSLCKMLENLGLKRGIDFQATQLPSLIDRRYLLSMPVKMPLTFAVVYRREDELNPEEKIGKNKYGLSQRLIRGYNEAREYIRQNAPAIKKTIQER